MENVKIKFVLGCGERTYLSDVIKTLDEVINHTFLLHSLVETAAITQGTIFGDKPWVIKHKLFYSGKTDKNGEEIYECDILRPDNNLPIMEIEFTDGAFYAKSDYDRVLLSNLNVSMYENIGSIYSND